MIKLFAQDMINVNSLTDQRQPQKIEFVRIFSLSHIWIFAPGTVGEHFRLELSTIYVIKQCGRELTACFEIRQEPSRIRNTNNDRLTGRASLLQLFNVEPRSSSQIII